MAHENRKTHFNKFSFLIGSLLMYMQRYQHQEDRKLYPCLTFKKLFKVESCQFNLKNTSNNQNFLQKMYLMPCYSYCPGDLVAHMGEQEIRSVFKRLWIIQENWYRCNCYIFSPA